MSKDEEYEIELDEVGAELVRGLFKQERERIFEILAIEQKRTGLGFIQYKRISELLDEE